jgi:eukaryotic-like serine/threonine-protein kinase
MLSGDRLLGHYRLVRRIGGGGMGEVYLAEDTRIERQVAIKVVRSEREPHVNPLATQESTRLFQREMQAIAMLDHPHILSLIDFGEEQDGNITLTYMVMPYRQEGALTDWLQRHRNGQRLTPGEVAHFVMQAADALQHAHDHHLIHQDVKPSNFLVRNRSSYMLPDLLLMDFGIAKITTATVTASQNVRGTPAYMAPEQWKGHPLPATDQYALATMAYLLLTGRTPFSGRMEQLMLQHLMTQPPPPSNFNLTISSVLDAVILRALEKESTRRFGSVLEFAQAFQQSLQFVGNQSSPFVAPQCAPALVAPPPPVVYPASLNMSASTIPVSDSFGHSPVVTDPTMSNPHWRMPEPSLPPPELKVSPEVNRTRKPGWLVPLLAVLTVLVIVSSIVGVSFYQNRMLQINGVATATVNTDSTSTARAEATQKAQEQLTATAQASGYPSYLSGRGRLAFFDPLTQPDRWYAAGTNNGVVGGACQFSGGAYHVSEQDSRYFQHCVTNETYTNFAFEVELTVTQGDCGGMTFREKNDVGQFYYFQVCENGRYGVRRYTTFSGSDSTNLRYGDSVAIKTGLGQRNKIAIVASTSTFIFYVNGQQIDQVQDSTHTSGCIGLIAYPQFSHPTDAAYSNARVWVL